MPETKIEPFPESILPKRMQGIYKGEMARHMYRYYATGRGPAKAIIREFEKKEKAGRQIAFSFHDLVFFFAKSAAAGIVGNLAWTAIRRIADGVRVHAREIIPSDVEFLSVVPKDTYDRLRKNQHQDTLPRRKGSAEFEEEIRKQYSAMVPLKSAKKSVPRRKPASRRPRS